MKALWETPHLGTDIVLLFVGLALVSAFIVDSKGFRDWRRKK